LDFDPKHSKLADEIAQEAIERATEVGTGRVGRSTKWTMKKKARLAARATIRHGYTDYEGILEDTEGQFAGMWITRLTVT